MSEFERWLAAFFASYYRRRPVNATFIGFHDYDDRLPDLSENGIADSSGDAQALLRRLNALPPEPLTQFERMDRRLAEGFLVLQRWQSASAHFGPRANPTLFTGEAIFGLIALLLQHRAETALPRLAAIPSFLETAMRQIRSAPRAWIDRARRECHGARLLLRDVAVEFPVLQDACAAAVSAFARFDGLLQNEVVATDEYGCGEEALDLLLRQAHFVDIGAESVERMALDRMAEEEISLARTPPSQEQAPVAPPLEDEYLPTFRRLREAVWQRARELDAVTVPDWPVRFLERPAWARAAAPSLYFLPYRSPPPLDCPPVVDYLVPPGSDESTIKLNHVVHHGSIGHHLQNWFATRSPSRIGQIAAVDCASRIAMLCGGTLTEGWANYATDLAAEWGLLTPAEEYAQHRARVRMAARAVVDTRLHRGRFTLEQAAEFYSARAGMSREAAYAEAVKNSLFPGAACMYLLGWDAIWKLRMETERDTGTAFSLRAFHDQLLSFGSVPVTLIAQARKGNLAHV